MIAEPKVSIGIPTFNRCKELIVAIRSVSIQSYKNIEIIISDNASTDGTEEVCRREILNDSRIIYTKNPINSGATGNFNKALHIASGKYFMWLADDDYIDHNYIEECVAELNKSSNLVLVSGLPLYYKGKEFSHRGRVMNINDNTPFMRVKQYYKSVSDNGLFYGVYNLQLMKCNELTDVLGGDWHFIANALQHGGTKVVNSTHIHRRLGGASENWQKLASAYHLPRIAASAPFVFIALSFWSCFDWKSRSSYIGKLEKILIFCVISARSIEYFAYRCIFWIRKILPLLHRQ